jgi:hypothetical protein
MLDARRDCRYRRGPHRSIGVGLRKVTFHNMPGTSSGVPSFLLTLIHPPSWKKNSPKFAVTSGRRFGLQGWRSLRTLSLPARIEGKFVGFVARDCYEQWRLATLQLPENFSKERHLP